MTVNRGLHINPTADDTGTLPRDARLATGGLLAPGGITPLSVRTGVLSDNGTPVVSGTTGLQVNVRSCRIVSKFSDGNGPTIFTVSATESLTIPAPPGSGSRWDVIYALQPLITGDGGDGGTTNQPIVGIASGNPAGAPVVPSIPAGAVEVSRGIVSSSMTRSNQVAWSSPQWTVANGGVLPAGRRGQFWDGAAWKSLVTVESGTVTSTPFWTPTGTDQTWTRHDNLVTLGGGFNGDADLPAVANGTAGVQLNGPPRPTRDRGLVIRSGNRLLSGWITPTGLLQWGATIGSGSSKNVTLDGLTYEVAST